MTDTDDLTDLFTLMSKIPDRFKWWSEEQIIEKLTTAEKAAKLFFSPQEHGFDPEDGTPTVFFINGYNFLMQAQSAIFWKLKAGMPHEKKRMEPLFAAYKAIYLDYYQGFR